MKKICLSLAMLVAVIFSVQAQETRINLYGGYVFDDDLNHYYDSYNYIDGTVKGGFQYGASLEFLTPTEVGIELMYLGRQTTLPLTIDAGFSSGPRVAQNDFNMNYALVSLNKYSKDPNGKLEGYGGLMMGCLFSDLKNTSVSDSVGKQYTGSSSSATRFTWGLKLGANYWFKEKIGVKFQAQFLSTTEKIGETTYYTYYGTYYGYATKINMLQWCFSTGLVFKLGGK
jgi:hypothetical protein